AVKLRAVMLAGRWAALVVGLWVALGSLAGCHHATVAVPMLGVGPLRAEDPSLYEDVVNALRAAGHPPVRSDPEHGRFSVRATSDPNREIVFVVQCSRDGYVIVTPESRRLRREGEAYLVAPEVRTEWSEIIMAIERSVP